MTIPWAYFEAMPHQDRHQQQRQYLLSLRKCIGVWGKLFPMSFLTEFREPNLFLSKDTSVCVRESQQQRLKIHDPNEHLATEPQREKLLQLLMDSALESDMAKSVLNLGPENLIRRFLPPGKYSELYHLYASFQVAHNLHTASPTTFYRILRSSGWRKVLRFRPLSQHSACNVCSKLKSRLRHSSDIATHAHFSDLLMRHLCGQFQDRKVYWELRTRAKRELDILTVITDSMDKSKFALPRYNEGRAPKDIANLHRPTSELTAALIHGRIIFVAVGDEGTATGTSWVLEVLNRALDLAYVHAQQRGLCWPNILKIFADNTPKDPGTLQL